MSFSRVLNGWVMSVGAYTPCWSYGGGGGGWGAVSPFPQTAASVSDAVPKTSNRRQELKTLSGEHGKSLDFT